LNKDTSRYAEEYLKFALDKQPEKAISLLEELADSKKLSMMDLFDILTVAQQQVSCDPHGVITLADEHYRTDVTLKAIDALSKKLPASGKKNSGSALIANLIEREHHVVGLRMFAELLKGEGWKVDYLASPMNAASLFKRKEESSEKFDLACCTVTMKSNLEELTSALQKLRAHPSTAESTIVVGSPLFSDRSLADKMTDKKTGKPMADFLAKNFGDGLEFVRSHKN
jgi:methanogenic corrinoid protein MtbC1